MAYINVALSNDYSGGCYRTGKVFVAKEMKSFQVYTFHDYKHERPLNDMKLDRVVSMKW